MFAQYLWDHSATERDAQVVLQNQLIPLLSEQLYRSPIKAIEELVVNSYDAGAEVCRLFVPTPTELSEEGGRHSIVVFDDGSGMDVDALVSLWDVGRSPKTALRKTLVRKQIGKFGIGKLATYAVAYRLTYITKTNDGIYTSSLNYRNLEPEKDTKQGETHRVDVPIRKIDDWETLASTEEFELVQAAADIPTEDLNKKSWTIAILEDLRTRAKDIKHGRLTWVLETAMPLKSDFKLYLNGDQIESSKSQHDAVVDFCISDLPEARVAGLNGQTDEGWHVDGDMLVSKSFPAGVSGTVVVARKSLAGGKSDDLQRSHGFFVRALGRLINLEDASFGMPPQSHKYFNRLRVDINADDLDDIVGASREGVELSDSRRELVLLLKELFNEARNQYDDKIVAEEEKARGKHEDDREYVPARYVEHPLADVISSPTQLSDGADADRSWFYLDIRGEPDLNELALQLYNEKRSGYNFEFVGIGNKDRIVKFDPQSSTFTVNTNHEFVQKHRENGAQAFLEDFVLAETLLEVYLREEGVSAPLAGEILERRDELFRSLANDELQSPERIAQFLEDASENEYDLEIGLVVAARALGFTAVHQSGADKPDGVAAWVDHPNGVKRITLEAKSSKDVPSLSAIDFAGLMTHISDTKGATGCLLVAPDYPGVGTKEEQARASKNARECKISCWTIRDLASVVRLSQDRYITARDILNIVETQFEPLAVEAAVKELLGDPSWDRPALLQAIIEALETMQDKLADAPRTIDQISALVSTTSDEFEGVTKSDIGKAVVDLAAASQGTIRVARDGTEIRILTSLDEVKRRASSLLKARTPARKPGQLRHSDESQS